MEKISIANVEINKVSIKELLFNKTMFIAYILLAIGVFGIYEIIEERYLSLTANAFDAGLHPGSKEVALAMREAVFGHGGEVHRQLPWTIFIANYMYMIYTGSGIIFIVALAELFNVQTIKNSAAGFMTIGLCMVFGGLFTIMMDLNSLHLLNMLTSPNFGSGMWLMLPLYSVYIPFVLFEIYLLIVKNSDWAKKIAIPILLLSIVIDIVEYYIQAKLFNMNTARHLWTTYPLLPLYFIVSAFVAGVGVMFLYSFLNKNNLKQEYEKVILFLQKIATPLLLLLASYEVIAFLFIDKRWTNIILFGDFSKFFYLYTILTIVLPYLILSSKYIKEKLNQTAILIVSLLIIIGSYLGRVIFVYGGNAYPMSDRFGTGFEKYGEYEVIKSFIFYFPSLSEIAIAIGSVGVVILLYKLFDQFLEVSKVREH